ncbi:MAG: T9SS type A sorting domain-containing protein [Gemmatimonadetes bacterium]|nr:T9SS type A sorting domain-containing protein [Gemmatimonadota bacterium]MYC70316.1 T9SS type A sorting domain-containing protein [Gemmatimonadota bacterium]MYI62629.1 T9SS type A sorting domain-containing protein [Gemmatimonadota bacterium]
MYRISILAVSLLLLANSSSAQSDLFVITTDFSTGSTAFLAANAAEAEVNLLGIHSDAVGHYHDGRVYIINRLGQDNILVLDAMDLRTPLTQFSVGNGANPHDIEIVAPDKAYVTRYETASLLIVNLQDGAELGEIDLSAFADADGLPEVSQIVRVGDRLYLSCQRLDRDGGWGPVDVSYLIVVDIATDTLVDVDSDAEGVQGIALSIANPNSMAVIGEQIAVGVVSNFGDRAGGVEIVDTATNRSLGLAVSEEDLGGDITSMVLVDQNRGYAVVADENFANSVRPFDLSGGTVDAPLENISGGFIPSLAVDGDRLIVADRGSFSDPASAGLKLYDAATGAFLSGPIDTGLPPQDVVVLSDVTIPTAVEETADTGLPQEFALEAAYPNPFNASVQIPFAVWQANTPVELTVHDVLGRTVRTLIAGTMDAGRHVLHWDGRSAAGESVGNGAYLVQLRAGSQRAVGKVMLIK